MARVPKAMKREHETVLIGHELTPRSRALLIEGVMDAVPSGRPLQTPISIDMQENLPAQFNRPARYR